MSLLKSATVRLRPSPTINRNTNGMASNPRLAGIAGPPRFSASTCRPQPESPSQRNCERSLNVECVRYDNSLLESQLPLDRHYLIAIFTGTQDLRVSFGIGL